MLQVWITAAGEMAELRRLMVDDGRNGGKLRRAVNEADEAERLAGWLDPFTVSLLARAGRVGRLPLT